jgi:hypothetical protein
MIFGMRLAYYIAATHFKKKGPKTIYTRLNLFYTLPARWLIKASSYRLEKTSRSSDSDFFDKKRSRFDGAERL